MDWQQRRLPEWLLACSPLWPASTYVPVLALLAGLLGMTLIQLRWTVSFLRWPLEVMYGEALIQAHAARLLRGEPLYQALGHPSYSVAAYTPVFYAICAAGQWLFGPNLLVGRVVAVGATLTTALLVGRIAGRGRGLAAGALAGLLFVGLGFPNPYPWLAIGKEDTLGVALSVASVFVLTRGTSRRRCLAAGLLAALAFLTKQTMLAAMLAGTLALATRDLRASALFLVASVLPVAVVAGAIELSTHAFVLNTVTANAQPLRAEIMSTNLATLKAYEAGPLFVAGFAVVRRLWQRGSFDDVLLPLYGLATLLPLFGLGSIGSAQNYWIELAAASSLLAASEIGYWLGRFDLRGRVVGAALACLPLVNVIVAGHLALVWLPALTQYSQPEQAAADFAVVLDEVHRASGTVLAEPLDALALAGKPVLVEPWASDALYQSGTWDVQPLVERICAGEIQLAVLTHSLDREVVGYQSYGMWPRPVQDALQRTMVLRGVEAGRYIYVPSGGGCS